MRGDLHDTPYPVWLEFLPGALTWGTFLGLFALTLFVPTVAANLIIVYAVFWLSRALMMSARLVVGFLRYRRDIQRDWSKELATDFPADSVDALYHMVIIAATREDPSIVNATLESIANTSYRKDRLIVVVTTEGRYKTEGTAIARAAKSKYGRTFAALLHTVHPPDIAGEVMGKGSNITWAGKQARLFLDRRSIPYDRVITTTLDSDNRVHAKYFAALSYLYLKHPDPVHVSFQPIPMFFNNIWEVPMPIRSVALGSSYWQLIESTRPYRLRNFSAHAQSFEAVVATNYWSTKTIVEDGHQFWRSYFRFNGQYDVVPMNIPVYQDAVLSPKGYLATFREQYLQKRRWAWGCSDIPYVLYHTWKDKNLPKLDKWYQAWRLVEGHFSWSTTSIILAVYSWLPAVLMHGNYGNAVIAYTFPTLYSRILTSALVGMAVTQMISMILLPPRPKNRQVQSAWSVVLEWVTAPFLLPISGMLFSSIPAVDAQTRLLLGKYLGFRVTEKHVARQDLTNHPATM